MHAVRDRHNIAAAPEPFKVLVEEIFSLETDTE